MVYSNTNNNSNNREGGEGGSGICCCFLLCFSLLGSLIWCLISSEIIVEVSNSISNNSTLTDYSTSNLYVVEDSYFYCFINRFLLLFLCGIGILCILLVGFLMLFSGIAILYSLLFIIIIIGDCIYNCCKDCCNIPLYRCQECVPNFKDVVNNSWLFIKNLYQKCFGSCWNWCKTETRFYYDNRLTRKLKNKLGSPYESIDDEYI